MNVKEKQARAEANKTKAAHDEWKKSVHSAGLTVDLRLRCGVLADIARLEAPDDDVVPTVRMALEAARTSSDAYQLVLFSVEPIAALVARDKKETAEREIFNVLEDAQRIAHPVSKLHALESLWGLAQYLGDAFTKQAALDALLAACRNADSWRSGRSMGWIAQTLLNENPREARQIVAAMPESRYKRRAQKMLDAEKSVAQTD